MSIGLAHLSPARYAAGMRCFPFTISALCLTLAGCSNAPVAGTMDTLFPSKPSRTRDPDPRDIFDRDRDPLPAPDLRSRDRDDPLPPPGRVGGLQSNPRRDADPPAVRPDPFRSRNDDPLPPPLPAPGFLDPIGPGRN